MFGRPRKPRLHKVSVGDSIELHIKVHDGRAWRVLMLTEVTTTLNEGTTATFVSLDRLIHANGRLMQERRMDA